MDNPCPKASGKSKETANFYNVSVGCPFPDLNHLSLWRPATIGATDVAHDLDLPLAPLGLGTINRDACQLHVKQHGIQVFKVLENKPSNTRIELLIKITRSRSFNWHIVEEEVGLFLWDVEKDPSHHSNEMS